MEAMFYGVEDTIYGRGHGTCSVHVFPSAIRRDAWVATPVKRRRQVFEEGKPPKKVRRIAEFATTQEALSRCSGGGGLVRHSYESA